MQNEGRHYQLRKNTGAGQKNITVPECDERTWLKNYGGVFRRTGSKKIEIKERKHDKEGRVVDQEVLNYGINHSIESENK